MYIQKPRALNMLLYAFLAFSIGLHTFIQTRLSQLIWFDLIWFYYFIAVNDVFKSRYYQRTSLMVIISIKILFTYLFIYLFILLTVYIESCSRINSFQTTKNKQEPITRSVQLPHSAWETAFLQIELFLDIKAFTQISSQSQDLFFFFIHLF